jgi:hypothetical protein
MLQLMAPKSVFEVVVGWPARGEGHARCRIEERIFTRKLEIGHAYSVLLEMGKVPVTAMEVQALLGYKYTYRIILDYLDSGEVQRYITAQLKDAKVYQRGLEYLGVLPGSEERQ